MKTPVPACAGLQLRIWRRPADLPRLCSQTGIEQAKSSAGFVLWPRKHRRRRTGSTSTRLSGKSSLWRGAKFDGIACHSRLSSQIIPIIFITGYGDIPMTVGAMKAGAVEFLTKPFRDQDLLDAIQQALERDRKARDQRAALEELRSRFASLTPREREVMARVVAGLLNKQIGAELGTSENTVKIHRHQVMEKMGAGSLPELVRMADRLGTIVPES
jgi:RNA polymerase sigma factor (sigma-70 family)